MIKVARNKRGAATGRGTEAADGVDCAYGKTDNGEQGTVVMFPASSPRKVTAVSAPSPPAGEAPRAAPRARFRLALRSFDSSGSDYDDDDSSDNNNCC